MNHGLAATVNYQWASAFDDTRPMDMGQVLTRTSDSQVRNQQLAFYGSYDLPFGKGSQFTPNANRAEDLLIGGYQLSWVTTVRRCRSQ